jgi:hypothetical protein
MLATLTLIVALVARPTHLEIQPWTGNDLQTTSSSAAKYRLLVTGRPNASVHLRASGVASGWLAAFCTAHLCSPQRVDVTLPSSGLAIFQFELIREAETAPRQSGAQITAADGASVSVPAASRQ